MTTARVSVIMPSHDEAATVGRAVESVLRLATEDEYELILVDDASSDRTPELLRQFEAEDRVRVVRSDARCGRGASLRAGAAVATGDILAFLDADLEYDTAELPVLVAIVTERGADAVLGSRTLGPKRTVLQYWRSRMAWTVTMLSNAFTDLNLTDATTGLVVIRREVWDRFDLHASGFDIDVELVAALAHARASVWEVPVSYGGRLRFDGRKSRLRDYAHRAGRVLSVRWRLNTLVRREGP